MKAQVSAADTSAEGYALDDQRQMFLEAIDTEQPASTTPGGGARARRLGFSVKLIGSAAAVLATFATAGAVVMSTPTAANAGGCGNPDPRPADQRYACGEGEWFYKYLYKYQNGTNVGQACYVFDLSTFFVGCSYYGHPGPVTRCGRDI
jgi:hypothetical protein